MADKVSNAVAAWKARHNGENSLTPEGRDNILTAGAKADLPHLSRLFLPYHRFALAAVVPAALLAAALMLSLPAGDHAPASITVEKVGNQVVFNIANGGSSHSVSRSNTPHSFDPGNSVRIDNGSYRDSMSDNGDLVFYKID